MRALPPDYADARDYGYALPPPSLRPPRPRVLPLRPNPYRSLLPPPERMGADEMRSQDAGFQAIATPDFRDDTPPPLPGMTGLAQAPGILPPPRLSTRSGGPVVSDSGAGGAPPPLPPGGFLNAISAGLARMADIKPPAQQRYEDEYQAWRDSQQFGERRADRAQQASQFDRRAQMDDRRFGLDERRFGLDERRDERAGKKFDFEIGEAERKRDEEMARKDPDSDINKRFRASFKALHPEIVASIPEEEWGSFTVDDGEELRDIAEDARRHGYKLEEIEARVNAMLRLKRGRGGFGGGYARAEPVQGPEAARVRGMYEAEGMDVPNSIEAMIEDGNRMRGKARERHFRSVEQIARGNISRGASQEKEDRKRADADASQRVPGWRRLEGAPKMSPAEAQKRRQAAASLRKMAAISKEVQDIDKRVSTWQRVKGAIGIDNPLTARQMQLQKLATTELRILANMGVPSLAEMAIVNAQAPELTTVEGWVNGSVRFAEMVNAMQLAFESEMQGYGYVRESASGGSHAVDMPAPDEPRSASELQDEGWDL